jgi:aldehyde dehydrogenase (NAD+)
MRGLQELDKENCDAYMQDHMRDPIVYGLQEKFGIDSEAEHALTNLDKWMAPIRENVEVLMVPAFNSIEYEPMGVVCIYGAWNVPFTVTLGPLINAIAAGNCALLKPSEMSP